MLDSIVKEIADTVKENVQSGIKMLADRFEPRIKALEERTIPEAIKGDKGDSVTVDDVMPIIKDLINEIPAPKDGEDGTSVTIEDVKPLVDEAVTEAVKGIQIPQPKDGKDAVIDYDAIQKMIDEAVLKAVSAITIPVPRNGEDGRDAIDLEIEPSIDEEKSYQRGVYASHNGGLWRSFERTKGMRGWECIVDGIADIDVQYDGARSVAVKTIKSSGNEVTKDFSIPAMIYKDIWKEGEYKAQDCVTLSGSLWCALEDTTDRPGDASKAWRMVAKRGGTGKSAYDIAREAGFSGTREQWLGTLGKKPTVKL